MTTESMYQEIGIRPEVLKFGTKIEKSLKERFDRIDETAEYNQLKVIHAMQKNRVWCGVLSTSPAAMATTIWEEIPGSRLCFCFPYGERFGPPPDHLWNPCPGSGPFQQFTAGR